MARRNKMWGQEQMLSPTSARHSPLRGGANILHDSPSFRAPGMQRPTAPVQPPASRWGTMAPQRIREFTPHNSQYRDRSVEVPERIIIRRSDDFNF